MRTNSLFPSQFVNIHLKLDTLKNVVIIPTAAVQRGTQGTFVYLVKDPAKEDTAKDEKAGKASKTVAVQNITLGPADGETVSVTVQRRQCWRSDGGGRRRLALRDGCEDRYRRRERWKSTFHRYGRQAVAGKGAIRTKPGQR